MERLWMEESRKSAEQTVGDIQKVLGKYGAKSIHLEYEKGEVEKVFFELERVGLRLPFRVPCKWNAVLELLIGRRVRDRKPNEDDIRKAKKIAWRQTYRWIEAQMAYVRTGMVKAEEVFLPYFVGADDKTLFEAIEESGFKMLEHKK